MNRIKELREARKMKQIELCKICNVQQSTLSGWENGTHNPSEKALHTLADLFDVSIDFILCRDTGENVHPAPSEEDEKLWELREQLRRDPERQVLFSLAKDADITEVRQAVAILDALKKTNAGR